MTTTTLPLSSLVLSEKNVRQNPGDVSALAASIAAQGLLQNLIVSDNGNATFGVDGGGRRLAALQLLAANGSIAADYPVPVRIVTEAERTAASLSENVQREAMHPADEFQAFQTLANTEGMSIDRIADAFGVTPLVVERRLKLAAAAPAILEAFRAGEMTTEQAVALCSTDNHDLQVSVWNRLGHSRWDNNPRDLRKAVLAEEIDAAADHRVAFIGGVDAYVAAGGEVRRDLFGAAGDSTGEILTNPELLAQLVADKLQAEADALTAEGWGWVEIWQHWDWTAYDRLGTAPATIVVLSEADEAERAKLADELAALNAEHEALHAAAEEAGQDDLNEEQETRDQEIEERCEEINERIEALEKKGRQYTPEVMELTGCVICLQNGKIRLERGQVKAEHRKALQAVLGNGEAVTGGRETEPAGRKNGETLSDALRRSLLGHRNLAAQTVLATNPAVAKILQAVWAVHEIRGGHARYINKSRAPLDWTITDSTAGTRVNHPITDDAGKAAEEAFTALCLQAVEGLPTDDVELWECLAAKKASELDTIITYSTAMALSLAFDHSGLTAKVLDALNFDMGDHFQATHKNYTSRVSKQLNIAALEEAGLIRDRPALEAMKKDELARWTAERLNGSGWVPAVIRTPAREQAKAKPAKKKAAAKTN